MTDQNTYEQFWEEAVIQLLHPTQLVILEALLHLDHPVSPKAMEHISDGQITLGCYAYHCKRMAQLGLLTPAGDVQRRGATETFYGLRLNGRC